METPVTKLGVKETKELIDLMVTGVSVYDGAMADGKLGLEDLAQLFKLAPVLQPALDGVDKVIPELMDLDSEEGAEVVTYVVTKLAVQDPKARAIITAAFKSAVGLLELYRAVKMTEAPASAAV